MPPNHVIEAGDFKITRAQVSSGVLGGLYRETRLRARVVTCEEVFELQIALPDVVAMQTRQRNLEGDGAVT